MGVTYFKRFRMELDLRRLAAEPALPLGYALLPWSAKLLPMHADVKYRSFREELDVNVFPCLGDREGCRSLMDEISRRNGFVAGATWLMQYWPDEARRPDLCGTIQGVADGGGYGAVQNVGVTPEHRGRGVGGVLLHRAMVGFRDAGLKHAFLEVTAQNVGAVRLYERFGFKKSKTVYKAAEVEYA